MAYNSDVTIGIDADVSSAESAMNNLEKSMDKAFKSPSSSMKQLGVQAQKLGSNIDKTTLKMKEIGSQPIKSDLYKDLESQLSRLRASAVRTRDRMHEMEIRGQNTTPRYTQEADALRSYRQEIISTIQSMRQMKQNGTAYIGMGYQTQEYADLQQRLGILVSQANTLNTRINEAHQSTHRLAAVVKSLFSAYGKVFRKLGNALKNRITQQNNDTTKSFKNMLRQVLKYGLGIRSLFLLYKKLRQYGKEAFKDMATQYPEINAQLSDLAAHFSQMTHSIATAFQPLLSVVLPILNTIIDALITAANALGTFFAVLTGQGFIYKAIKQQKNFAGAVSGTGGAAKEAKEELAEYDKLLVIDQDNGAGGGGGGGGGAGDTTFFEKSPLMEGAANFAQMIKDAWAEADFTEVGEFIGTKLTNALNSIPWTKIQETAGKVGKSIATLLNGLISPDLFSAFGTTFAEVLNTTIEASRQFLEHFNWDNLGNSLAAGVNTFFATWNLDQLAKNIHTAIVKASHGAVTFFKKTDFIAIGEKVASFINGIITPDSLGGLAEAIGGAVNSIADTLYGFVQKIDWKNLGTSLVTSVNKLISTINWGTIGSTISSTLSGLMTSIAQFLKGLDSKAVWNAIKEFIAGIDWLGLAESAIELLFSAFGAVVKTGALIVTDLRDTLEEVFYDIFEYVGENGWEGLWEGFWNVVYDIATWLDEKFHEYILDPICEILGIASPSKVFEDIGDMMMQGLLNGLVAGFEIIKTWVLGAVDWLSKQFEDVLDELFGDKLEEANKEAEKTAKENQAKQEGLDAFWQTKQAGGSVDDMFNAYLQAYAEVADPENADKLLEGYNKLADFFEVDLPASARAGYKDTKKVFKGSDKWAEGVATEFSSGFNGMPSDVEAKFRTTYEKSIDEFKGINQKAKQWSNNTVSGFNGMPSAIEQKYKDAYRNGTAQFNGVKTWAEAKSKETSNGFNGMPSDIQARFANAYKAGTSQFNGTKTWAETTSKTASDGFNGMPSNIQTKFKNAYAQGTGEWKNTKQWSDTTFSTVVTSSDTQMKKIPGIFSKGFKEATTQATNQITGFKSWYDKVSFAKKTLEVSVNQGAINGAEAAIKGLNAYWTDKTATYTVEAKGLEEIARSVNDIIANLSNAAAQAARMQIIDTRYRGPSNIPHGAAGMVLPPNKPFLAMVGDQASGTNVETPLSTMIQAFNAALDSRGSADSAPIIIQVDGREMARVVWDENEKRYKQTGRFNSRFA